MSDELLPPPDLAPSMPKGLPSEQYISAWLDLMAASEQFLLAGLRRKIGPKGDLRAAYQEWYRKQMEEHDQMMLHMMGEFARRSGYCDAQTGVERA